MPKTQTQGDHPIVPTEEIYNLLMREIEPDLTTSMIPSLDAIYQDESEEERKERGKRYAEAFETFQEKFEALIKLWKEHLLAFKEKSIAKLKRKAAKKEKAELQSLEQQFDDADASSRINQ